MRHYSLGVRYYSRTGEPITQEEWAEAFENENRTVQFTKFKNVEVSTVWIGLDHSFLSDDSSPEIFETMIFGGIHDNQMWRYSTEEQAIEGHKKAVMIARTKESKW